MRYRGVTKHEILSRGNKVGNTKKRNVLRISIDGKESKLYDSITDAAKDNNSTTSKICMVCSGERLTADGYRWQYYNGENIPEFFEPLTHCHPTREKEVHQYSDTGEYIQSFKSMMSAARSLGKTGIKTIDYACKSKSHLGYGYRWSFEKYDILPISDTKNETLVG